MNRPGSRSIGALRAATRLTARSQRGATAVLVAICIVMLCLFLALAINAGHILSVRGELQNSADSGALAGALELDGTLANLSGAKTKASDYTARHFTDTVTDVVAETVQLGQWATPAQVSDANCSKQGTPSPDGHRFCLVDEAAFGAPLLINAVRVVTARTGPAGSPGGGGVELFASGIIAPNAADGRSTVRASAVAVTGGPCDQGCADLPIVIRAGCLKAAGGLKCTPPVTYFTGLSPAPDDTAGLTGLSDVASADTICDVVDRSSCSTVVGESVGTQDGSSWNKACTNGCSFHSGSSTWSLLESPQKATTCEAIRYRLDKNCDGEVDSTGAVTSQVPVIQYPDETPDSCPAKGAYNKPGVIVGYATVEIVSARCDNSSPTSSVSKICDDKMDELAGGPVATGARSKCIAVKFLCNQKDNEATTVGCGWFGTSPLRPVLVR